MLVNADLESSKLEYDRATIGIKQIRIVRLTAGDAIFRFASTREAATGRSTSSSNWSRGAWWLSEEGYRLIISRYLTGGLKLGTVGRTATEVMPSWSLMDVSIKARLRYDTLAYAGPARRQEPQVLPNGMTLRIKAWPEIEQLYIPNLRGENGPGPSFIAIDVVRQKRIQSDSFGY